MRGCRGRGRPWWTVVTPLVAAASIVAIGGCGGGTAGGAAPPSPAARAAYPPTTAAAGETTAGMRAPRTSGSPAGPSGLATPAAVLLPVVRCPTSIAIVSPPAAASLPPARSVAIPPAWATRLSVYTDDQGRVQLVGPRGWRCTAVYGADGSGGVAVYPPGRPPPASWPATWALAPTSEVTAVVAVQTASCYTCTLAQACRLFPSAATALRDYLGRPACSPRPAAERVTPVGAGVVGFEDPPGVDGDGRPSGGRYPAHGVLTYQPNAAVGSYLATCTLPAVDEAECAAALAVFVSWYGRG